MTVGLALSGSAQAATDSDQAIIDRIKAVGTVCVNAEPCVQEEAPAQAVASAPAAVAAAPAAARSGAEVYNASCAMCHAAGVAGAPIVGDKGAWASRIAKGAEVLNTSALKGINAMPPRGTCMACSDEELIAAVQHMVDASK